jgi:hypothetical protein
MPVPCCWGFSNPLGSIEGAPLKRPGKRVAVFLAAAALIAPPANAGVVTSGFGVYPSLFNWSLGTDPGFGGHASFGVRFSDLVSIVLAGQIVRAHIDNHSSDHPADWSRTLVFAGVATQLDWGRFKLELDIGPAWMNQCVPVPLEGQPCFSEMRTGPGLSAIASYRLIGPLRAELAAAYFLIPDDYGGNSATLGLGLGASF